MQFRSKWAKNTSSNCCSNSQMVAIFRTPPSATEKPWCSWHTRNTRRSKTWPNCRSICCWGINSRQIKRHKLQVRKMAIFQGSWLSIVIICRYQMAMASPTSTCSTIKWTCRSRFNSSSNRRRSRAWRALWSSQARVQPLPMIFRFKTSSNR